MRNRIFNPLVCITGIIALFLLQGCDKGLESLFSLFTDENSAKVKQIDMKVVVPIHPSSLEYFNYCISYSDNTGTEYRDTVRNGSSDIIYWMKDFSYKSLPVICRCETVLIPKVSRESIVSFSYIIPKPHIFSRVIFSDHSSGPMKNPEIEETEVLRIDNMSLSSFMSVYGNFFISTCFVKEEYDGITCSSY